MHRIPSLLRSEATDIGPLMNLALGTEGKGFRSVIANEVAHALDPSAQIPDSVLARLELLHYSTLIHDDIIDRSQLRRGEPSLWKRLSPEIALLLGNYIHASIYDFRDEDDYLGSDMVVRLVSIFSNAYMKAHIGEIAEVVHRYDHNLSILGYFRIANRKTSSLVELAATIGWLFSSTDTIVLRRLRHFALTFGLAYQIYNDIVDFFDEPGGKQTLEDIRDGIPTLPILLFYRDMLRRNRSYPSLNAVAFDKDLLMSFLIDFSQSGVLRESAHVCQSFAVRAEKHLIASVGNPPPPGIADILRRFTNLGDRLPSDQAIYSKRHFRFNRLEPVLAGSTE